MLSRFSYLETNAEKKRVLYVGTNVIYEGMPLCYEFDTTTNIDGYDATDGAGTTTDEGHQNEGKYVRVQDPDADNQHAFAGVVAGSNWDGVTGDGSQWLEIYIANGAIVPVRADQNCVVGMTVLAINPTEQFLTAPHGAGRAVAVAWETLDRTTAGIILAKLDPNMFLFQNGDGGRLLVDDKDTAWQQVNKIGIEYAGSQWMEVLNVSLEQLAACTGTGLALKVELAVDKVTSGGYSTACEGAVEIGAGFGGTATAAGGYRALTGKINVASGADLSTQRLACLYLEHYVHAGATSLLQNCMIQLNATAGANAPDFFIVAQNKESIVANASAADTSTKVGAIKLRIDGGIGTCYIKVWDSGI